MDTLLLIDGNALLYRAFFALPSFKTKDGTPTNAIYGFFTMLYRALSNFHPQYIAVCFDTPKPTFRQKLYEEYQIQRPKIADELKIQFPLLKDLLKKGGVFQIEKEGYEADDVIGTIARRVRKSKIKTLVLTGDRDIMQVVDKTVYVVTPQIGVTQTKIYDEGGVVEKFGVHPEQIADFKALVGDPSDNYPGVKGIGPKTAVRLLKRFKTIERLLANLDEVQDEKLRMLLKENKKNIVLSGKLARIVTDVKLDFKLDKTAFSGFKQDLKEGLSKLEMRSLIARFFPEGKKEKEDLSPDIQINLF
ncbi:hypothetical protein HYT33_00375 [Candidatus Roizmanbacteria bacterium]|nr:hypothetical protein [Candidatus Roizmanbacteria bacterium]